MYVVCNVYYVHPSALYLHFVLQKDVFQHHLHEDCGWFQLALDHKASVQQIT